MKILLPFLSMSEQIHFLKLHDNSKFEKSDNSKKACRDCNTKVRSLIFMGLTKHYRAAYSGQLTVIRMRVLHYK